MRLLFLVLFSLPLLSKTVEKDESIGHFEFDLTGLSYHIGANRSHPANSSARRALDKNGAFVFNPGIGIGFDFRPHSRSERWYGFSPMLRFIYMQDCQDDPLFLIGPGIRYRKMIADDWSFDANLLLTLGIGKGGGFYQFNFMPVPQVGFNYHFEKIPTIGAVFTIAPKNDTFTATSAFWILFTSLRVEL